MRFIILSKLLKIEIANAKIDIIIDILNLCFLCLKSAKIELI